jgi:N6-L-threonylcarbamoyladenine synthase
VKVLGIESSCDETAAAVVGVTGEVFSDVVVSQLPVHARYGGVVPELASRAHILSIVPVVREAMEESGVGWSDLAGVAVTSGPGLVGSLLVGIQAAKAIAWSAGLPLVGVSHLEGHVLAVFLRRGKEEAAPSFPYVALLASGGHTSLVRVDAWNRMRTLGETRDDAAGEAFDKVAKLLDLGYPGGPIVEKTARRGNPKAPRFTRALRDPESLEFSFSGIKTAVALRVRDAGAGLSIPDVCASFQASVVDTLATKLVHAAEREGVKDVVLCGGVAANGALRARTAELATASGMVLHVPPPSSCTDNAAMIGYAGACALAAGRRDGIDLDAIPGLRI